MSIAQYIDHTLLKVDATQTEIEQLCEEALALRTYSVCINPMWVSVAQSALAGSPIKVCTVVGFPLGATYTTAILAETDMAIRHGATEIDMVMNVGALKSGYDEQALDGMRLVSKMAHEAGDIIVKVIVESAVLIDSEKRTAARPVVESGADFLKTSTGYVANPGLTGDVGLFVSVLPALFPIKAAGGIRNYETAKTLLDMGVARIGASSTVKIVEEERNLA